MVSMSNTAKVYIVGPDMSIMRMFNHHGGFQGVQRIEDADIVVFTGGADVHPQTYGEQVDPSIRCYYNTDRDRMDTAAYMAAKDKFKVGICRGGQFLNVMNGGKLWYDVDNHTKSHLAYEPTEEGKLRMPFMVTSTHHQMFIKGPDAHVFLVAYQATNKVNANDQWAIPNIKMRETRFDAKVNLYSPMCDDDDLEGLYYAKSGSMCFQPHPEYETPGTEMRKFFFEKLEFFRQQWFEQQAKVA